MSLWHPQSPKRDFLMERVVYTDLFHPTRRSAYDVDCTKILHRHKTFIHWRRIRRTYPSPNVISIMHIANILILRAMNESKKREAKTRLLLQLPPPSPANQSNDKKTQSNICSQRLPAASGKKTMNASKWLPSRFRIQVHLFASSARR